MPWLPQDAPDGAVREVRRGIAAAFPDSILRAVQGIDAEAPSQLTHFGSVHRHGLVFRFALAHTDLMAYPVTLNLRDFLDATSVAIERMRASARHGLNHANVCHRDMTTRLHNELLGAAAELAVAKWVGIEWSRSVNAFHDEADVGEDIDVRATGLDTGKLILRENDPPYRWFVLVTGRPPNLSLRGYIRGEDGMRPEWAGNPHNWRQAWFVPQSALLPITPDGIVPPCLRQVPQRVSLRGA